LSRKLFLILMVLGLAGSARAYDGTTGATPVLGADLAVEVTGVRSGSGRVLATLYASAPGYPNDPKRAVAKVSAQIVSGTAQAVFPDLPAGTYALSLVHDENDNGRLDTNWIGIPAEGVGASNNAKGSFGPPSFEAAKFQHAPPQPTRLRVKLQYI
jgi:uncharacterized protein (DUF2141 family)